MVPNQSTRNLSPNINFDMMANCGGVPPPVSNHYHQPLRDAHLYHHLLVLSAPCRLSSCRGQRPELHWAQRYPCLGEFYFPDGHFGSITIFFLHYLGVFIVFQLP